jgi:hypothetical protein
MDREPDALKLASAELMGTHRIRLQGSPNDNAGFETKYPKTEPSEKEQNHRND